MYAVPISPGKCRLINRNVVRVKGGPGPLIGKLLGCVCLYSTCRNTCIVMASEIHMATAC